MSVEHNTTLCKRLTHDCKTRGKIPSDDFQQRIRKLGTQRTMLVAIVHEKRIEARVLGTNREDEPMRQDRFLALQHGMPPRLKRESVCELRQVHF